MVPCPLCLTAAFSLAVRLARYAWCFAAQVSHLARSRTAGFGQSLHSPRDLASSRLTWAMRRCSSLRSGVWFLCWSYFCCSSCLASTSAGVGSGRRFGVAFLRGLLMVGFRFSLALGPPPALLGFGNRKLNSKVRPTALGSGVCDTSIRRKWPTFCVSLRLRGLPFRRDIPHLTLPSWSGWTVMAPPPGWSCWACRLRSAALPARPPGPPGYARSGPRNPGPWGSPGRPR